MSEYRPLFLLSDSGRGDGKAIWGSTPARSFGREHIEKSIYEEVITIAQAQRELPETNEFESLEDIQLVAKMIELKQDKARVAGSYKRTTETLAHRLIDRGETEALIGDHRVCVGPKLLTEYDRGTLGSLKNCVTDEQLWLTVKEVASGKQLKALSEIGGATAKSVIASAKKKIETDVIVVRLKKPRKPRVRGPRRRPRNDV